MAIGSTPAEAEDIAGLVDVEFEALPPVVTMADALKKIPPFVHDDWGDNILVDIKLEGGDLAGAKANAVHIVERSFRMNRMHPLSLEGRACLAHYDSRLTNSWSMSRTNFQCRCRSACHKCLASASADCVSLCLTLVLRLG